MTWDVAVIGAGIAGAAAAAELSRDHSVVMLDSEAQPGYHSTGRSVAMLDLAYGNAVVQALTSLSLGPLAELQDASSDAPFLLERGVLYVARPDQASSMARFHERVTVPGHRVEYRDGAFARAKVPLLRDGYAGGCAYEPDAREFDVGGLLSALIRQFRARGGQLRLSAAVGALERANGVWRIQAGEETLEASHIVNAAGAWADDVAIRAGGVALGLVPKRRSVCVVPTAAAPASSAWPFVVDVDEKFYFKQEAGRLLVSPADQDPVTPCDAWPEDQDIAVAIERLEAACDIAVERVAHRWAGLRPFFADGSPAIGPDPTLANFYWCAGFGGYGIQIALGAAACIGARLRGAALPEIARRCDPARLTHGQKAGY